MAVNFAKPPQLHICSVGKSWLSSWCTWTKMVVAEFKFCNQTVSHPVLFSTTVKDMISLVKQKWPYVPEDLILFGYTVDVTSNVINHDLELKYFWGINIFGRIGIKVLKAPSFQIRAPILLKAPRKWIEAPSPSSF
ncbi:hypothetical protein C5167_040895 [Papaver somniferum]|uniref:Uncharacterized protein n=1 Tax=Papaver somniferum TaxID=3469 RepID=A0A4Y7IIN4_PAPSO|nr:hypothetical protein C5167_040895 [Papaver somniferum]